MIRVQGYAERFFIDRQTIRGWVFDPEAADNRELRVVARFDGEVIGEAAPLGTRDGLLKITTQDSLFSVRCSRPFTALDLASGRLALTAHSGDREYPMTFTADGLITLKRAALAELSGGRVNLWTNAERDAVRPQIDAGHLSPVLIPAGLSSQDGSAVIGLRGHLFLTEGTNSVLSLYETTDEDALAAQVDGWVELFTQRQEQCEARGIEYVQTVIPEKMTVMRADAPMPIPGPSPALERIETRLSDVDYYVSGLAPFEEWDEFDDPYLMTDTHLTAVGAQRVFAHLAANIDPQLVPVINSVRMYQFRHAIGDLTNRFGLPLHSRIVEPSDDEIARYAKGLTVLEEYFPPTRGSRGRRFRWANSTAPSARKVLVLGNSFFGPGDFAGYLSWWGKHMFSEFHFHWGPEFDWDLVDQLQPDVIIGQTVERFLPKLPPT